MSDGFRALIQSARTRQGWDQAQLARQLGGVSQQTISRWERGTSRPRRSMMPQIAQILGLGVRDLLEAAGYEGPRETAPSQPVRSLTAELPLDELSEYAFERFSTDLACLLYPEADVHGYGSRGHKQYGIDVEVRHRRGEPTGIQCKRQQRFGPKNVRDAVAALSLDTRECIIFLSRPASPGARQEIAKHAGWRLWDRVDISHVVRYLPDQDAAIRLVDTYFPGHRATFLGVADPSPWETTDQFFRPISGAPVFSHDWGLVGRAEELADLAAFLDTPDRCVAIIEGSGGLGKTRLLRQFALDAARERGAAVRFVALHTPVEPVQFEHLPATDRLVVVIDDAHERSDVPAIVRGVLRRRQDAKIVISARPYARPQLSHGLHGIGIHPADCTTVSLSELSIAEARDLARMVLGTDGMPALVDLLATVARDCPLIIVVGAALIKRGELDPQRLHANDHIRAEILKAFHDAVIAGPSTGDPETYREVVDAVAALQPFRINEDEFREAVSTLTQRSFDQIMPYLRGLEGAGVLLRRGDAFRIVPDMLGDVVLTDACVDTVSAAPLPYLNRVYEAADGVALAHLFVNASRVDWQIKQGRTVRGSLVEPLWTHIGEQFARADITQRVALLKLLRKVAGFQPEPTLSLVRWAIANPTEAYEPSNHPFAHLHTPSYRDVLNELAPLLEDVAYHPDHLDAAAEILWRLAEHDGRKPNQHPDHPIRVLIRLMAYSPSTPSQFRAQLFAAVERWFDRDDLSDLPHSPFDVLEPLLATEGTEESSDGLSLTITQYGLTPEAAAGLRERVVDLAFAELESDDPKRAARAAAVIGSAIIYSSMVDGTEYWTSVFVGIIDRVAMVARGGHLLPTAAIGLRLALKWHYQYSPTATKAAALAAWSNLPDTLEYRFALVLHDGWGALLLDDDLATHERRREDWFESVAREATAAWPDSMLVNRLERALTDEQQAFGDQVRNAALFTWTLARIRPSIAYEICRRVLLNYNSVLRELIAPVLGRMLESRPDEGMALARDLLAADDRSLTRAVAFTLGWGRGGRDRLVAGEPELLRSLVNHVDPEIRRLVIAAGRTLRRADPALAAELVSAVRFTDSTAVADEVAGAFGPIGYMRWDELAYIQVEDVLEQLSECPSIETFNIAQLIQDISVRDPRAIVELLCRRIEGWERGSGRDFRPLPHTWQGARPHFADSPLYGDLLWGVLGWLAAGTDSWKRQYAGRELFALVAEGFDAEVLRVLREALDSGDSQFVGAVGSVLSKAPRSLLWNEVEFVRHALNVAQGYGEHAVQHVAAGLESAELTGFRWSAPGQPSAEEVEQRDQAERIAPSLPRGSIEEKFYRSLVTSAEERINREAAYDTLLDRREW